MPKGTAADVERLLRNCPPPDDEPTAQDIATLRAIVDPPAAAEAS